MTGAYSREALTGALCVIGRPAVETGASRARRASRKASFFAEVENVASAVISGCSAAYRASEGYGACAPKTDRGRARADVSPLAKSSTVRDLWICDNRPGTADRMTLVDGGFWPELRASDGSKPAAARSMAFLDRHNITSQKRHRAASS